MTDASQKEVSNLQVAFGDGKIDPAFWGHNLATKMGLSKTGEVYRFDWITVVSQGQKFFKLVSNGGTEVKKLKGADADKVRGEVKDTLVCSARFHHYHVRFGISRIACTRASVAVAVSRRGGVRSGCCPRRAQRCRIAARCAAYPLSAGRSGVAWDSKFGSLSHITRSCATISFTSKRHRIPTCSSLQAIVGSLGAAAARRHTKMRKTPKRTSGTRWTGATSPRAPSERVLLACPFAARMVIGMNKSF